MSGARARGEKDFSFSRRLEEIGMFFQKRSPQHQTMRRTARRLDKAGIADAILGGMALNAHGYERTTGDVDVLVTEAGLEDFCAEFVDKHYERIPGRPRRFTDRTNGVTLDFLVTGRFPGSGKPGPIAFPDPEDVRVVIDTYSVVNLPTLVQLKLAARRWRDFADVVELIRVHNLDESFRDKLHPSVHKDFIECLEEKRREDEYEAREG
jgi:hypothetical protein